MSGKRVTFGGAKINYYHLTGQERMDKLEYSLRIRAVMKMRRKLKSRSISTIQMILLKYRIHQLLM
jgi:hypothetical protein